MERSAVTPLYLSSHPLVNTSDLGEARSLYSHHATPILLERASRQTPFAWRSNLFALGPLTLTSSAFQSGIVARTEAVEDIYGFAIPVGEVRGEAFVGKTRVPMIRGGTCMIASPGLPVSVHLQDGFQGFQTSVRRRFIEDVFLALHGAPARGRLHFEPCVAIDAGVGAAMARLLTFIAHEVELAGPILSSPLLVAQYSEALIHTLLAGVPHNQLALVRAPRDAGPTHVRRVEEFIVAHADSPITLAELAAVAGVSGRSLQAAFRRHRGCSPMDFLREQRLSLARARLLAAPAGAVVSRIALDCGFEHLGRFSARYRERFGETPSQTLRRH